MASKDEHLAQAAHNKRVAGNLAAAGDFDWAVTALFYSALHLIQAHLVEIGVDVRGHARRERFMQQISELEPAVDAFMSLRVLSENARYDCRSFTKPEFDDVEGTIYQGVVDSLAALATVSEPERDDGADAE